MSGLLFQELPLDVLLLIFDYLEHGPVISLALCRSLKVASDAYLYHRSTVTLIDSKFHPFRGAEIYNISRFAEQMALNRLLALSVRVMRIENHDPTRSYRVSDSAEARPVFSRMVRFKAGRDMFLGQGQKFEVDRAKWLLSILLLCKNLESVRIRTHAELSWLHVAQHLEYTQWPHNSLTHLDITWRNAFPLGNNGPPAWREHDLQDIWLLISAPTLKSIVLTGLEQSNNIFTGTTDRASIRTIYWPIELEILSIYHHIYQGQCNNPQDLPSLPSKSPFTHEFVHLDKLILENFSAPSSWLPILLCSFKSLRMLKIGIDSRILWRQLSVFPIDFCLVGKALHQLAPTLEEVVLSVSIPTERPKWTEAAMKGRISVGSLDCLHQLKILELPWFSWLPYDSFDADTQGILKPNNKINLPPKLEKLTLRNCHVDGAGLCVEPLIAALASTEPKKLGLVHLQATGDFSFNHADAAARMVEAVGGGEIVLDENQGESRMLGIMLHTEKKGVV